MTAMIVDAEGVRTAEAIGERLAAGKFFWLDISDGPDGAKGLLGELGLKESDVAWALRFGQTGRMSIGGKTLRASTWMADAKGALLEVHVVGAERFIVTIWSGDAAVLDEIREQFAERIGGVQESPYLAAGIVLQLLLSTLDHALRELDLGLDDLKIRLESGSGSAEYLALTRRLQKLQSFAASFSRYASSVGTAIVGVETISGVDERSAEELNEYAQQVEDVEEELYERRRWMSDSMHDYATAIAQRQGEQINRLTLVSLIFLPMTALTGFFGMNFNWMIDAVGSATAFFILGVALPLLCVTATIGWLMRRGLIQFGLTRPPVAPKPAPPEAETARGGATKL